MSGLFYEALKLRAELDQDALIDAASLARTSAEYELLASLNDEEQSAVRNLLTAPTLTLSDERATLLEYTAAEQTIELLWAFLRARRGYLLAVGAGR